jgi:hypothetical protein
MHQCGNERTGFFLGWNGGGFLVCAPSWGWDRLLLPGALFTHWQQRHRVRPAAAVAGAVEPGKITPELIDAAAAIADISITAEKRTMMLGGLEGLSKSVATIRGLKLPNSVAPPFVFDPVPGEMILE